MEKVVDFLEKYVQWIAIGLGAVFVLFMVYSYVLTPPAQVQLGGEALGPGEVDPYTYESVGKKLEAAMNDNAKITIEVPTYVQGFKDTMAWQNAPKVELAGIWTSQTKDVQLPPNPNAALATNNVATPGAVVTPGDDQKVTALPVPPPAEPAESKFGRSVVLLPPAPGQQPEAPAAPVPGQPVVAQGVDKDWVTQLFHLNVEQLNAAFKQSRIPNGFTTAFLQVEMERQELMPDGSWGNGTIVPPVPVYRGQQAPPPFPAEGAGREVADVYLQWASANPGDVIQPLFYTVERGDQWQKPGPLPVLADQVFDPSLYLTGEIPPTLTQEQRDAVLAARREAMRLKQEQQRQSRPARPAPGGGRGMPGGGPGGIPGGPGESLYAPAPAGATPTVPGAAAITAAGRPPMGRPGGAPPYRPIPGGPMETMDGGRDVGGPGGYSGAATPQNLPQPGTDYPAGEFSPADPLWATKVIDIWAHDETIKPESTYRYRIRYRIKNPVFFAGNVTNPESLADQFALTSEWSAWSSDVKVPPQVNFFVATSKSPNGNTVTFDLFKFDRGETKSTKFVVSPGDTIGGVKEGVEYKTAWTVVDFRRDERTDDWQILLVNDDGKLVTRSFKADQGDALYKALIQTVKDQKAAQGVAAGNPAPPPMR